MPRVPLPSVQNDTGGVGQFAVPGAVTPRPDVTSRQTQEIGQDLIRGGAVLARAASKLQDDYDDAKVQNSLTHAMESANDAMNNPETGYLHTVGERATGENRRKAFDAVAAQLRDIEKGLDNDVQRQQFRQQTNRYMLGVKARADEHEQNQIAAMKLGSSIALQQSAMSTAIQSYRPGDENTGLPPGAQGPVQENPFRTARATVLSQASSISDQKGERKAEREARRLNALSTLNVGVIQRLVVEDNTKAAQDYFDRMSAGDLTAEHRVGSMRLLKTASIAERGTQLANDAMATAWQAQQKTEKISIAGTDMEVPVESRRDLDQWHMDALQTLNDNQQISAEERDNAKARVNAEYSLRSHNEASVINTQLNDAESFAKLNGVASYEQLPSDMRVQMEKTGAADRAKLFLLQGGQWVTTNVGVDALLKETPQSLLRFDSVEKLKNTFRTQLSDKGIAELVDRWNDGHKKPKTESVSDTRISKLVRWAMQDGGFLPGVDSNDETTASQRSRLERVTEAVTRRAEAAAAKNGTGVTDDMVKDMASKELVNLLRTAKGEKVPLSAATLAEKNAGFVDTPYGEVELVRQTPEEDTQSIDEIANTNSKIAKENEMTERFNAQFPEGSPRRLPLQQLVEVTPLTLSTIYARRQAEARAKAEALRQAQLKADAEFRRSRDVYGGNNPYYQFSSSPWGNR